MHKVKISYRCHKYTSDMSEDVCTKSIIVNVGNNIMKTYQRKGSLPYQTIYLLRDSLARIEGYVYDEVIGFEEIEEDKNDKL